MPRYTVPGLEDFARAGAASRVRISGEVDDDARVAREESRWLAQQERSDRQEMRANQREDRIDDTQSLRDEITRWEWEKNKALDRNAAVMKIETDKQAIEGNEALFKINTADDDAPEKLAEWGAKYFRVLDEKTGDPRLIRQFQINQTRAENRQLLKARASELRATREEKLAADAAARANLPAGFEETRITIGNTTFHGKGKDAPNTGNPETYAQVAAEKKRAAELRGGKLTPEQERQFARREQELITAGRQVAPTAPAAASTPPAAASVQFNDESEARAAGAKPGDIVIIINPATGKPARARLN